MGKTEPDQTRELTIIPAAKVPRIPATVAASIVVPAIVADAGDQAARRFLEFFAAAIRNKNTRTAYLHAVGKFFVWCEHHRIGQLADIGPLHVAAYIEALGQNFEKPTVKQYLAAIRMLLTGWSPAKSLPPTRRSMRLSGSSYSDVHVDVVYSEADAPVFGGDGSRSMMWELRNASRKLPGSEVRSLWISHARTKGRTHSTASSCVAKCSFISNLAVPSFTSTRNLALSCVSSTAWS